MARYLRQASEIEWTNGTGAAVNPGDIVKCDDGRVGIVNGSTPVPAGAKRFVTVSGQVVIDKAVTSDNIAAKAVISVRPSSQKVVTTSLVSTDLVAGTAVYAAGTSATEVVVMLNDSPGRGTNNLGYVDP